MQFPESWLRALVNPPLSSTELCHLLTMAGLEVEDCRPVVACAALAGEQLDSDNLITLKLTPNRADCLSILGIAREVAALTGVPFDPPEIERVQSTIEAARTIVLDAPAACPRYCGRIVRGVNAGTATPDWMKQRIEHCGVRSISALVDITNYVMLELGQPLHVFDDARLQGTVHVRYPCSGEQLLLLNEQTVTPTAETALIADDVQALALAGIMGGERSGVTANTTDIFLESAFFAPAAIAGKARALGFASDASYRYERGVDFELQRRAIERATRLIVDICGGRPGPVVEVVAPEHLPQRQPIRLRTPRVAKVLGIDLGFTQVEKLIAGLGFVYVRAGDDLAVTPPAHRYDIAIEEDLIEEIARLHGYDNIQAHAPTARLEMLSRVEACRDAMDLRRLFVARGYHEVVNYSFVNADWEVDFAGNSAPIRLANPIASQMGVMRSSLIGGLVDTLAGNLKRQTERVCVFEIGRCFLADDSAAAGGYRQPRRAAWLAAGHALPEQWGQASRPVDFYDVKGDLEEFCAPLRLCFERADHQALHPGRAARVLLDGVVIGVIGEIHPRWQQKYELQGTVIVCEVDLDPLLTIPLPSYQEVSRYPAVTRDIALVLPAEHEVEALRKTLLAAAPSYVREIRLFDVYQGKGIAPGSKSLAFRVTMQDTQKTLADSDAEAAIASLLQAAQQHFGARLRA